jgi:outer membrane immunogenic protein
MKRIILGITAALCLSAGQAAADGMPSKGQIRSSEAAGVANWNGFYVGVGVGAGAVNYDTGLNIFGQEVLGLDGFSGQGVFGTVAVGYDRQIRPGWVLGVFADYDFASNASTDLRFLGDTVLSVEKGDAFAVGARFGFLPTASTLVYGTGGYTRADFGGHDFDGYFVGAGIETMLRDNWSLKLEYRYSQFDDVKFGDDCFNLSVEPSEQTARLVLSYKFGHRD